MMIKVKRNNGAVFEDGFTTAILVSRSGGWVTINTKDGIPHKYRSGQIIEVPFDTPDEAPDPLSVPIALRKFIPKTKQENAATRGLKVQKGFIRIGNVLVPKDRYIVHKVVKTKSGRSSVDNGDVVAENLRGVSLEKVYLLVSDKLGIPVADLKAKYTHLNPGMQRMTLGNLCRKPTKK